MIHRFRFPSVPKNTPARALPDGPIAGNGDLTLVWSGEPDRLRLYFTKCDFWKASPGDRSSGGLSPMGYAEIGLPLMADSAYDVVQNMDEAFIEGRFSAAHTGVTVRTEVCASENIILLEINSARPINSVAVELHPVEGCDSVVTTEKNGDLSVITRAFPGETGDPVESVTAGCAALKEISRRKTENGTVSRYVIAVSTNHDVPAYRRRAEILALSADDGRFDELRKAHSLWWKQFWEKSSLRLPFDETVENQWYADLYVMACCARNRRCPPGLWGGFATADNMPWHSDYHLNYNYQAPFYGLPVTNHIELMDCYDRPIEDFVPYAALYARKYLDCRGVYFPVGIGPMGLNTSCIDGTKEHGQLFLGQKSNAAFCATVTVLRWNATRDTQYAREHGYPFLREIASFWEDYLVYENGRYVDYNDSLHEVGYYSSPEYHPTEHDEVNPVISLGLIAMTLQCLLDMRKVLGIDEDREAKWRDILDHLSAPVYYTRKDGKEAVRGTEQGMEHSGLILQYVYPAYQVGSRSDKRLLDAMRNVLAVTDEWESDNRFCTFYPAAVRLGIDPDRIFEGFHTMIDHRGLGNGLFRCAGGGIENNAAIPSTVGDMVMQSFEGVLRLFPCWNLKNDVSFRNFRADGAFLVSADLTNGVMRAEIVSALGGTLVIEPPAFGAYVVVQNGKRLPFGNGDMTLSTAVGETLTIVPAGIFENS